MKISKIYIDLDGVLADFVRGIKELCGIEAVNQVHKKEGDDDLMWEAVKKVEHFYDKLELMPGASELFKLLSSKYDVEILSGIPKARRGIYTAGEDKISWVHRLLSKDIKVNIVYRNEKKNFVTGPDCILIDDLAKNIREWNEAGGTGILFSSPDKVIEELERIEAR